MEKELIQEKFVMRPIDFFGPFEGIWEGTINRYPWNLGCMLPGVIFW